MLRGMCVTVVGCGAGAVAGVRVWSSFVGASVGEPSAAASALVGMGCFCLLGGPSAGSSSGSQAVVGRSVSGGDG